MFSADTMANEESVSDPPLKRRRSLLFLPPDMSELRAVLLGNSWSERSSVGNFLLGKTAFKTKKNTDQSVIMELKDKRLVLINTPNLLHHNISQKKLTQHVESSKSLSDPGPHVFLLVIQPEDFTEENSQRIQSIMENFSKQSWSHSVLLISAPEEETSSPLEETFPSLRDLIKKCRVTLLWNKNLQQNLLTCMLDLMKENKGEHVTPDVFRDAPSDLPSGSQRLKQEASTSFNQDPEDGALRIVLFGKTDDKKTSLGNILTGKQEFKVPSRFYGGKQCVCVSGEFERKPLTVVKTPDVFSLSVEAVRKEMKRCVELCSPGPNVLLLLVKPSEFTEDDRKTLMFILSLFGQDVFKHSMVVLTHEDKKRHYTPNKLIQDCQKKVHSITDWKNPSKHYLQKLMKKMETIVSTHRGASLVVDEETDVVAVETNPPPRVNLVLFGRRGAGKTSVVNAILGQGRFGPAANSSECVRTQGLVCGQWVSVVELPALYGRPQKEVMEESLSCVSLCDPEGVHAFIMVLPEGPLTDEDKGELQTIQKTFSSQVNDFTIILFTVESQPSTLNFLNENKELQELVQSCSGEHFVFNVNGTQELSRLIYKVGTMRQDRNGPDSYTKKIFDHAQIRKIIQQEKNNNLLQAKLQELKVKITGSCDEEKQNTECLRIVLVGKTGCGKSSSGNTILGRKEFKAELGTKSVTKHCQKALAEVNNRTVAVVDTPGLFDNSLSNEEINEEMVKCVSLLAPGPHVFLLVVRIGRFTQEEKETLKFIRKGFGKNSLHFTFILLTGGDELEKNEQSIEQYMRDKCDDSFKSLIVDCGGRFHVFNNYDQNPNQVSELIAKIDTMVKKNGGDCFTNEMLQEAEAAIMKEMEKRLKEKEEEMKREREELEKQHQEEIQKMMMILEEQREKLEEERKVIKEQLDEKEENIRKERELRKREQEEREEEDRKKKHQEDNERRQWEQKLGALEKKIKSEQKETIDKKLVESREEMRKEREIWEEERKELWKEREKENEEIKQKEQRKLLKLQKEFEHEKEKYENKRREEDEKKREEEEKKIKELEEKYKKELENMKKKHEEEARKQAEEFNEFKISKENELAALIDKHLKDVIKLKETYFGSQQEQKKESEEKEKTLKDQMDKLLDKHKEELTDMTLVIIKQQKENHEKLQKLRTKHKDDMNKLLSDLKKTLEEKLTEEIDALKEVHQNEMEALEKDPQTENKEQRKTEMFTKNEEEIKTLRTNVEAKGKRTRKEKMDELQKKQDEEINKLREEVLDETKTDQEKQIDKLEKQQDEQMKTLYQKIRDGDGDVKEFEELRKKHEEEMTKLKEELFPDSASCSIS